MAGSKTILFIEDDPLMVDMYVRVLKKASYDIDIAYDGVDGIKKALNKTYDLILLDIMIPQITGIDVLEKLRQTDGKGLPDTKIVILTNLAQDEESRRALEAKADGYLIKADITPSVLVSLIGQVLD
jgi:two-component system, chemotaxis family, sensor kinase CheA